MSLPFNTSFKDKFLEWIFKYIKLPLLNAYDSKRGYILVSVFWYEIVQLESIIFVLHALVILGKYSHCPCCWNDGEITLKM